MNHDQDTDRHATVATAPVDAVDGSSVDTAVYFQDLPELSRGRTSRRPGLVTSGLVLVIVAGLGFFLGVKLDKESGGGAGGAPTGLRNLLARGGLPDGAGGGLADAGGGNAPTTGTVKLVDGDTLYVTTSSGEIVKVKTTSSTAITRTDEAEVSDVRPGDSVTVTGGSGDGGGTVTASRIEDNGPSGEGGGPSGPSPGDFEGLSGVPRRTPGGDGH